MPLIRTMLVTGTLALGLALSPAAATAQATDEPPAPDASVELPDGVTAEMVAEGRALFGAKGNCWACHGRNAAGGPLAPDLTDSEWLHVADGAYDAIVELITAGVPTPKEHPAPMPPKGGSQVSNDEIRALAAYLYALSRSPAGN